MKDMMDRLCFSTLGCPDWSLHEAIQKGQEYGFRAIEIRGSKDSLRGTEIPELGDDQIADTKAMLAKSDIVPCIIDTSCNFHDEKHIAEALVEGKEALTLCKKLGSRAIRVFGDRIPEGTSQEQIVRQVSACIRELLEASEGDVDILLETHGDFNRLETVLPILEENQKYGNLGIIWDVEHTYKYYGNEIDTFYEAVKPWIKHVHIKDGVKEVEGFSLREVGAGDIDLFSIIGRLEADRYSGYYSLEWEKRWQKDLKEPEVVFPAYIDFMKNINQRSKRAHVSVYSGSV